MPTGAGNQSRRESVSVKRHRGTSPAPGERSCVTRRRREGSPSENNPEGTTDGSPRDVVGDDASSSRCPSNSRPRASSRGHSGSVVPVVELAAIVISETLV